MYQRISLLIHKTMFATMFVVQPSTSTCHCSPMHASQQRSSTPSAQWMSTILLSNHGMSISNFELRISLPLRYLCARVSEMIFLSIFRVYCLRITATTRQRDGDDSSFYRPITERQPREHREKSDNKY